MSLDKAGLEALSRLADQAGAGEVDLALVLHVRKGRTPAVLFLYDEQTSPDLGTTLTLCTAARRMVGAIEDQMLGPAWSGIRRLAAEADWTQQGGKTPEQEA